MAHPGESLRRGMLCRSKLNLALLLTCPKGSDDIKCRLVTAIGRPKQAKGLEVACVATGAILFALAFTSPVLAHFSRIGEVNDWDRLLDMQWVPFYTVSHFHQLPLWNPYECGGVPLLGNPQSRFLSPFFLLHLLFGPVIGFHLEIILHLAIAWSGGYVLARVQGLSPLASTLCGSIYAGSSWFSLHLAEGHEVFLASVYLPWIVALLWLGFSERVLVPAAGSGLLIALTIGEGGVYQVLQAFVLAALLGLTLSVLYRSYWPIATVAIFAAFSAGFAAFKLLPVYGMMHTYPRAWDAFDYTSFRLIYVSLFSRVQDLTREHSGGQWGFWEHGAYIGPLAAVLALFGAVKYPRAAAPWLIACVVFLALATGQSARYSPWNLLHKLPIFSSSRVPSRFLIPFTLAVGVLASFGSEAILKRFKTWGFYVICLTLCAMLVDFWRVSVPNLRYVVSGEPYNSVAASSSFRQVRDQSDTRMLASSLANEGSLHCYEYTAIGTAAAGFNEPTYRGEQYLLGPGSVRSTNWTPNAIDFVVDAPVTTTMIVNQNYDPSWRVTSGANQTFSQDGLLAVRVPAGKSRIVFSYISIAAIWGMIISMLTAFAAFVLIRWESRRPSS